MPGRFIISSAIGMARLISCFGSSWGGNGFSGLFERPAFFTCLGLLLLDRHV